MSGEPENPSDAPAESPSGGAKSEPVQKADSGRTKRIVAGAAIGIGSAALVAALLYANRARKSDKA